MLNISPLTCIIILNWNNWRDTEECVKSCRKLKYLNNLIVIIDNNSSDGSHQILGKNFPEIKIIQTGKNLGFAGGNNIGIKYAIEQGAEYIWLLNNDTIVDPESLTQLLKAFEEDKVGMVGSKIYYYSQPKTIWFAGGNVDWHEGTTSHRGVGEIDQGQYNLMEPVDYITGCSLMVSREFVEDIGLMDEEYFLYYEETAWCTRAHQAGYKIMYAPKSIVYHKVSASTIDNSPLTYYYMTRNRLYFLRRFSREPSWLSRVNKDMRLIWHFIVKGTGSIPRIKAVLKAYIDFFTERMGKRF